MSGPRREGAATATAAPSPAGTVVVFKGWGFGVEPCPVCRRVPKPGDERATVTGEWRVYHRGCFEGRDLL